MVQINTHRLSFFLPNKKIIHRLAKGLWRNQEYENSLLLSGACWGPDLEIQVVFDMGGTNAAWAFFLLYGKTV